MGLVEWGGGVRRRCCATVTVRAVRHRMHTCTFGHLSCGKNLLVYEEQEVVCVVLMARR